MTIKKKHTLTGKLNTNLSSSLDVLDIIKSKKKTSRASQQYKKHIVYNSEELEENEEELVKNGKKNKA